MIKKPKTILLSALRKGDRFLANGKAWTADSQATVSTRYGQVSVLARADGEEGVKSLRGDLLDRIQPITKGKA